jgi:serine/threonine-protein kinase ULK/ATG1
MYIIDFGFAQYLSTDDQNSSLRGSPLYMAPEILLKHKYDARVDLWSVGVIMYECLFGRAPYSSNNFKELAEKIKSQMPIQVIFYNYGWTIHTMHMYVGKFSGI